MKVLLRTMSLVTALVLCCTVAFAATWYVKWDSASDGPGTAWETAFHTVGQAITASSTGDTILVAGPHAYAEAPDFTKQLTVTGVDNPTINASSSSYGVVISAATTFQGFTVSGGHMQAISIKNAATGSMIKNCVVNVYTYGKGICVGYDSLSASASARIDNNIITGGSWKSEGIFGCIISYGGNSIITSNLIKNGALGIYLYGSGSPSIYNNTIVGCNNVPLGSNPPVTKGGGIYITHYSWPLIENNIFANNNADYGGAYYIDRTGGGSVQDMGWNTFYGNTSNVAGYIYYPTQENFGTIGVDGNNEDNPLFVGSTDFRLQSTSPCIGNGNNDYAGGACSWKDVAGLPRVLPTGGVVDRGCYEGASVLTNTRIVGDWVELRGKPVTGNFGDMFYIEEPSRVYGVKVAATSTAVAGDLAVIDGQYAMVANELTLQPSAIAITAGSATNIPAPFGMNNKALGGINVGLLVRVWGKVTSAASGVYTIDDGSGVDTTVLWSGTSYSVDDFIVVTGVSCYGCVRATGIEYITTFGGQQLMSMSVSSLSSARVASVRVNRTDQKLQGLLNWRAFVVEQLAKIDGNSASEQNWRDLWTMMLDSIDKQIAELE